MRAPLPLLLTAFATGSVAGCRCIPATPQPVTLRIVNSSSDPIYLDGTGGKLGLSLQREVGGQTYPFDDLACPCRFCDNACDSSCTCPDAGSRIVRVLPGGRAERTWDGVVQVSGASNCARDGCLDQQNAPVNEPFTLELCFAVAAPNVTFDDAGVAEGQLPLVGRSCTTKLFAPQDLTVEIGPSRGSACTTTADCKGLDEQCFDGACTSGCPANDFPDDDSVWLVDIGRENMGFFTQSARGPVTVFSGTGTITSAVFQGAVLQLSFSRPGPVPPERLTGSVQVRLPPGYGPALTAGASVTASVLEDAQSRPNRALVVRGSRAGELLFAADMGRGARLLEPADYAPLALADGTVAVGCDEIACGRRLVFPATFSAGGEALTLTPGEAGRLSAGGAEYRILSVGNGVAAECPISAQRPWAVWKQ